MATARNISGEDLYVPELRGGIVVEADQVVEIPDERVTAFGEQTGTWATDPAYSAPEPPQEPASAPSGPPRPARNASREVWEDYALQSGKVYSEVVDLGRNEIRDLFPEED